MSIKIAGLSVENVKRVELVELVPSESGLTILGGDNRQGKSSVLDAIAVALGGEKLVPTNAVHDGAEKGQVGIQLSNGWTVQRFFTKEGTTRLKIVDAQGMSGGQKLLDDVICKMALRIGDFLELDAKEKTKTVLQASGIDLTTIEQKIKFAFDERQLVNREVKKLQAVVSTMTTYQEIEPVSVDALLEQQAKIVSEGSICKGRLLDIDQKRKKHAELIDEAIGCAKKSKALRDQIALLEESEKEFVALAEEIKLEDLLTLEQVTKVTIEDLLKQHADVTDRIKNSQEDNRKAAANAEAKKKRDELVEKTKEADGLTEQIETLRKSILEMCAAMPLEGLAVVDGELTYQGKAWDCMSHSDQLIIATSIVQKLNPQCGFILIDKLESMDLGTLSAFGAWLEKNGVQAIVTRVSKGKECSVIITDGKVEA